MNSGEIDHIANIERFIEQLGGEEWLSQARPSETNPTPNPIALWVGDYRGGLRDPAGLEKNQSFLRLSRLAFYVSILKSASVANLDDRLDELHKGAGERVLSAVHEIQVAGEYVARGNSVAFIPETTTPTADIAVNGSMEVECKYKTGAFSSRDKNRMNLYKILNSKLQKLYHAGVEASGLVVEATFEVEPTREMIDEILAATRSCLRPVRSDPLRVTSSLLSYTITTIPGKQVVSDSLTIPHGQDVTFQTFQLGGTVAERPDGSLGFTRPIALGLRCKVEMDVVGTIRSSIKSAIKQLTGDCPGVVVIDVGDFLGTVDHSEVPGLTAAIEKIFQNNSRLSRLELVADYFAEIEGRLHLQRKVQYLENNAARRFAPRV
ncbi:hypothetical protein B7C42_06893 [Nocardia cerradoensis]|uniref:Uncharacterized protein n=1 Tax=Nocardia cerradoensis TaxID=85688 RepID=A0A231GWX6_9NOCA|nr:hypothetical protein [Nocardia cerradoensis]OXR41123.1 hypothetical protein B7C42_06893 [Nocardia cerradoensis]